MDKIRVMIYDKESRKLICWKEYYNFAEAQRYCNSIKELKEVHVECKHTK